VLITLKKVFFFVFLRGKAAMPSCAYNIEEGLFFVFLRGKAAMPSCAYNIEEG
jgi:glutaredoxin-related protein